MQRFPRMIMLAMLALAAFASCLYGQGIPAEALPTPANAPLVDDPRFEHGQPRKAVDAIGWVFGIPKKIILWDRCGKSSCVCRDRTALGPVFGCQ